MHRIGVLRNKIPIPKTYDSILEILLGKRFLFFEKNYGRVSISVSLPTQDILYMIDNICYIRKSSIQLATHAIKSSPSCNFLAENWRICMSLLAFSCRRVDSRSNPNFFQLCDKESSFLHSGEKCAFLHVRLRSLSENIKKQSYI